MIQPIPTNRPSLYTVEEVAQELRVTPATVRNMIRRGDLHAIQLKSGCGLYRIPATALHALLGSDAAPETRNI